MSEMRIKPGLVDVIKESGHPVEVLLLDRIVFMVMTTSAAEGQAQKSCSGGGHAVGDVLGAKFLLDTAAFIGLTVQAVESGGQDLVASRRWHQVTRYLPEGELVIGEVLVKRADDPVAPR